MTQLVNNDSRELLKQDRSGVRTPEDVMRRLADNVKITSDEVKGLTVEVSGKVGNDEIISRINQSAEAVTIDANKININGTISANGNFKVNTQGNMTCNNAVATDLVIKNTNSTHYTRAYNGGLKACYDDNEKLFGNIDYNTFAVYKEVSLGIQVPVVIIGADWTGGSSPNLSNIWGFAYFCNSTGTQTIKLDGSTGNITCVSLTQTSKEEYKKNFEKLDNALDIVKETDIYKYNLKKEKNTEKKHIGFVIGDKFKYRQEITSKENDGVDIYSMVSVLWKAVQEQQKEIEELKKVIK